jgi:dihydrofolate reductase
VQIEFYKKFQSAHLESIVGQKVFEYLKPFFVKPLKDKIHVVASTMYS